MSFLETDVQGSDHICRDLMDDLTAIEDESDDLREFIGNANIVRMTPDGVYITYNASEVTAKESYGAANDEANSQATHIDGPGRPND